MEDPRTPDEKKFDLLLGLVCMIPSLLWFGWALSCLWGWFVVPLGVMPMGALHAAGLGMAMKLVRGQPVVEKARNWRASEAILNQFVYTALCLGIGWAVHCAM